MLSAFIAARAPKRATARSAAARCTRNEAAQVQQAQLRAALQRVAQRRGGGGFVGIVRRKVDAVQVEVLQRAAVQLARQRRGGVVGVEPRADQLRLAQPERRRHAHQLRQQRRRQRDGQHGQRLQVRVMCGTSVSRKSATSVFWMGSKC